MACPPSASTSTTRPTPKAGASTPSGWARRWASTRTPYSDYGRLEGDIWRAIRLVVDTGVHVQHWTREQMVEYFHEHSNIDDTSIQAEVDRYIAWPSQALAYKIGQLKILELRERAKKALGDKFDIRAFHDQVLDSGRAAAGRAERPHRRVDCGAEIESAIHSAWADPGLRYWRHSWHPPRGCEYP